MNIDTGRLHALLSKFKQNAEEVICEQLKAGECDRSGCIHGKKHAPIPMPVFNRDDREFNCMDWDVCYKIGNPGKHRCVSSISKKKIEKKIDWIAILWNGLGIAAVIACLVLL